MRQFLKTNFSKKEEKKKLPETFAIETIIRRNNAEIDEHIKTHHSQTIIT